MSHESDSNHHEGAPFSEPRWILVKRTMGGWHHLLWGDTCSLLTSKKSFCACSQKVVLTSRMKNMWFFIFWAQPPPSSWFFGVSAIVEFPSLREKLLSPGAQLSPASIVDSINHIESLLLMLRREWHDNILLQEVKDFRKRMWMGRIFFKRGINRKKDSQWWLENYKNPKHLTTYQLNKIELRIFERMILTDHWGRSPITKGLRLYRKVVGITLFSVKNLGNQRKKIN